MILIRSILLLSVISFCVAVQEEYRSVQERLMEFRRLGFEEQHQRHLQMVESGQMLLSSEHEQMMQDEYEMNRFDYLDFKATGI